MHGGAVHVLSSFTWHFKGKIIKDIGRYWYSHSVRHHLDCCCCKTAAFTVIWDGMIMYRHLFNLSFASFQDWCYVVPSRNQRSTQTGQKATSWVQGMKSMWRPLVQHLLGWPSNKLQSMFHRNSLSLNWCQNPIARNNTVFLHLLPCLYFFAVFFSQTVFHSVGDSANCYWQQGELSLKPTENQPW